MHSVIFGVKRVHQGALRISRKEFKELGLTAARFDMLYAIKESRGGVLQSVLRDILGYCRATTSKMLISLEKLGLIKRSVYPRDRRQRLVELTWPGRKRLGAAKLRFMWSGWAELAFASAISSTGLYQWHSEESVMAAKSWLIPRLDALREGFDDVASLEYPWDPQLEALVRIEDEAFEEDPADAFWEREHQEGRSNAPPDGPRWNGEGPCPWSPRAATVPSLGTTRVTTRGRRQETPRARTSARGPTIYIFFARRLKERAAGDAAGEPMA